MFITRSMTRKVITLGENESIFKAQELMAENNIRHLPIVDETMKLLGIVTDRDIRSVLPYQLFKDPENSLEREKLSLLKIKDIMSKDPVTILPSYTIQDALLLIQEKKVGAVPVVDDQKRVKGIISVRDLLRAFINVLGIGEPGTLIGVLAEERVGELKKIIDAITGEKISLGSVLVARSWEENKRAVFPYLLTNNVIGVKKKLKDMGYDLIDPMQWTIDQSPHME